MGTSTSHLKILFLLRRLLEMSYSFIYKLISKFNYFQSYLKKFSIKTFSSLITLGVTISTAKALSHPQVEVNVQQVSSAIFSTIKNHSGNIPNYMRPIFISCVRNLANKKINEYILKNQVQVGIYEMTQLLRNKDLCTSPGGALKIVVAGITAIKLTMFPKRVIISKNIISESINETRKAFLRILFDLNYKTPIKNFNSKMHN